MSTEVTPPRAIDAGVGTDQLPPGPSTVEAVSRTYQELLANVLCLFTTAGVAR